jgi:P2-related tail formation protein
MFTLLVLLGFLAAMLLLCYLSVDTTPDPWANPSPEESKRRMTAYAEGD